MAVAAVAAAVLANALIAITAVALYQHPLSKAAEIIVSCTSPY